MGTEFSYPNWKSTFGKNAATKGRHAYLTEMTIADYALAKDIAVISYWPDGASPAHTAVTLEQIGSESKIKCVGIIQSIYLGDKKDDPLSIVAYISEANRQQLVNRVNAGLKDNKVPICGFWGINFDIGENSWYEEFHPKEPATIAGQINGTAGNYQISIGDPTTISNDVKVCQMSVSIVPQANNFFVFASNTSSLVKTTESWGLVVNVP